ncbi:WD repeat-containing protein 82 [Intoshia linei]|uniref:WD repeat-containing protein 82 n=1 Tax=Intoshia linei TaxID=1819745 RepID=A0A177B9D6_9BILA|nr:WD repeat-containing protein 82 [Intoshia linei]
MHIKEQLLVRFKPTKVFSDNSDNINSLDFSRNGETLITSSNDDSIQIYDAMQGIRKHSLNSKKYGVSLIRCTHANNTAIHASTKVDDTIRYLSLHDNKYIRYFSGHSKRVINLEMSPNDDTFISSSEDNTFRIWDLRSPNCHGLIKSDNSILASYDPEGILFAIASENEKIKLFDKRSFDKGPFLTFKLEGIEGFGTWNSIKFNPNGKNICLMTQNNSLILVNAFKGNIVHTFSDHVTSKPDSNFDFTPDGNFLFNVSASNTLNCWKLSDGKQISTIPVKHKSKCQHALFNPLYMSIATAGSEMIIWLPEIGA